MTSLADQSVTRALALHRAGRLDEAHALYVRLLETQPAQPQIQHLLGMIAIARADYPQAVQYILQALAGQPLLAATNFNLGVAYSAMGQGGEAIAAFERALVLDPDDANTCNALAGALGADGQVNAAMLHYRRALALDPRHSDASNNLGTVLEGLSRTDEAIVLYRASLAIDATHPQASYNLASAMQSRGEMVASADAYEQAICNAPDFAEARWGLAMCALPAVFAATESVQESRLRFADALTELDGWLTPERLGSSIIVGSKQPFYLAYQDENNCGLLSAYGDLCVRLMQRWASPVPVRAGGVAQRLKVGIVSAHIYDHSVWNAIIKAWLRHLDAEQFELQVFHLGGHCDAETEYARSRSSYHGETQSLASWIATIREAGPDVLVYPEIGMDALTVQLACLRLAPVQVASWGHPETSGLPTMDYYLSAEGFEAPEAQSHYREKLVMLPRLGCCYAALPVVAVEPDLAALGVEAHVPLLLCSGSPFKYGPDHDQVFVEIAQSLGACQFVFFIHDIPNLTELFRQRLQESFETAGLNPQKFCRFVPFQHRRAFYGLMQRADVLLDTIGFSGFNSAMQAIECGLPIVTRDGAYLRGNLAAGILGRIELQEMVASSDAAYVAIAVRLVQDAAYNRSIRAAIESRRAVLFDDVESVRALEHFLLGFGATHRPS